MEWPEELWFNDINMFTQKYIFIGVNPRNNNYGIYSGGSGDLPKRIYYDKKAKKYTTSKMGTGFITKLDAINKAIHHHQHRLDHLIECKNEILEKQGKI